MRRFHSSDTIFISVCLIFTNSIILYITKMETKVSTVWSIKTFNTFCNNLESVLLDKTDVKIDKCKHCQGETTQLGSSCLDQLFRNKEVLCNLLPEDAREAKLEDYDVKRVKSLFEKAVFSRECDCTESFYCEKTWVKRFDNALQQEREAKIKKAMEWEIEPEICDVKKVVSGARCS